MAPRYTTLAEFLAAESVTQSQFAERVGVEQPTISRIVNGRHTPSLDLAVRIATAASIPVESLLAERDDEVA